MTVNAKSATYLGLVFFISWPLLIGAWLSGAREPAEAGLYLLAFAVTPGLSAILCTLAFERGRRREALGLRFRPNIWWLWAAVIPLFIVLTAIALTAVFSSTPIATPDAIAAKSTEVLGLPNEQSISGIPGKLALNLLGYSVLFTLAEELGWRGYLYSQWRPIGFWTTSLFTGLIWGVWHWPMIYLYGLNYPNAPIIGLMVYPIYTMLSACLMTAIRDRGGSVWAAGIMHGSMNTFPLLFLVTLGDLGWPWGVAGVGAILATGVAVATIRLWPNRDAHPMEALSAA